MNSSDSTDVQHLFQEAVRLHQSGALDRAKRLYRQVLELAPGTAPAWNNLGQILAQQGDVDATIRCFERGIQAQPDHSNTRCSLATAYHAIGKIDAAQEHFAALLTRDPEHIPGLNNYALLLHDAGRLEEAGRIIELALGLAPDDNRLEQTRANILLKLGRLGEAVRSAERVLARAPDNAGAHCNLAHACIKQGQTGRGLKHMFSAVNAARDRADWHSALLMSMHYSEQFSGAALRREHERWARVHATAPTQVSHANAKEAERRLRVAYVSPDLRLHAVSFFIEGALRHHDAAQFDVFVYANVKMPDRRTAELQAFDLNWRSIAGATPEQVAARVTEDEIDILIDLAGHTDGHSLLAFARRPAPVQMTYLGYPNTTGLPQVDYRIADELTDPPANDAHCTEQLLRLPGGFLGYTPPAEAPPVATPAASEPFTFGSFNNTAKIGDAALDRWSRILAATPGSRLQMTFRSLADEATATRYRLALAARGVEPERLILHGRSASHAAHLARHADVDVVLDAFPYHGTTTTCEALWMGTPVLTQRGDHHVARVGASLLHRVGLDEFVTDSADEFVARGVSLARAGRGALTSLRGELRERMRKSTLCDPKRLARELERVYRSAWRRWCARMQES